MGLVRNAALGLALACTVTALPAAALAVPGPDAPPVGEVGAAGADDGEVRARAALAAVDRAFDGGTGRVDRRGEGEAHAGRQVTLLLRELRLRLDALEGEERDRAEGYLARPTGARQFPQEPLYGAGARPTNDCTGPSTSAVCLHWATATNHAPPLADGDQDGVPDHVETTRQVLHEVFTSIVTDGGYRAPRSDLSSQDHGPDGKLDVYLADIGSSGLYGYCTTDDPSWRTRYAVSAYCVLDDDFSTTQFRGRPLDNLRVTAAHEFFHAVQYAYDWTEDIWLLEGTAAWVEDELYDDVNDNLQYLRRGPLSDPGMPLDDGNPSYNPYASWIFWRYLGERFHADGGTGLPLVVRDVISRAGGEAVTDRGDHSTRALVRALRARDASLPPVMTEFAVANRRPGASYDEGETYPTAPLARRLTLRNSTSKRFSDRLHHLSTETIRVVPHSRLRGQRWKLRVRVEMPRRSHGYDAAITTVDKDGTVSTRHVRLRANGDGTAVTRFGRARVRHVEVTLTNASVRYACWRERDFACQGIPKDDSRAVRATVKAFR